MADSTEETETTGTTATTTVQGVNSLDSLLNALMLSETSPEAQRYKLRILERYAEEREVLPARIPAPRNITEVGGYYNLLANLQKEDAAYKKESIELRIRMLKSALGIPV